ncbi:head GIN domain-containing protein [Allomuricauda taeanensis]|uniref:head GIN domain-containing protein n=1 Tax=Flagellimonas taeanensis TaxID=1005926 RepID=UPI002E7B769D|nr:head GIN domain-containing protein [Allomuricauda taeanensis]MEE1963394.1 head GIN domain-containing protein [Allomuricauda taeanensis]
MKTRISALLLIGLLTFFSSCDYDTIHAHGEVTSVYHDIEGYTRLRISDAFQVYVHFSEVEEEIRIAANDNLHEKIVVEKDGDELVIRLKSHTSIKGKAVMNAYITTTNLSAFRLGGASRLTLENVWDVQDGKIGVSGASDFKGEVVADRLEMDLDGASSIDVTGSISFLDAELSGSSDLLDFGLDISNLDIDLSGASTAFLSVEETIRVKASGASTLNYKGDATILKSELSGSSHVTKKD